MPDILGENMSYYVLVLEVSFIKVLSFLIYICLKILIGFQEINLNYLTF